MIHNLDWLADEVAPTPVRGVMDSTFAPELEALDLSATAPCTERGVCDYASFMGEQYASREPLQAPVLDTTCLAMHAGEEQYCLDTGHVIRDHVTTPFFVRMGLVDMLISGNFVDFGFGVPGVGPLDLMLFAQTVRAEMEDLATLPSTAEEGAAMSVAPGAYGIACPKHETLRSDADTYDARLSNGGVLHAFPDVLGNWWTGGAPTNLTTDAPMMDVCP